MSQAFIHPTAIVHERAVIGAGVQVGAYTVVGEHAVLKDKVVLHSHVVVDGRTVIGEGTEIFPFASIGTKPQDLKFGGEPATLEIGRNNTIREHVTINIGTEGGGMVTRVGNDCLFMVGSHIGHDCQVGNHVILANNATLAGHVVLEDHVIIGGLSAIHQFVRIGKHAMIGGMSGIENDVVPYATAMGERAALAGVNIVGLKRRGFSRDDIHDIRGAYRMLFASEGTLEERVADVEEHFSHSQVVLAMLHFIRDESSRALCQPKGSRGA